MAEFSATHFSRAPPASNFLPVDFVANNVLLDNLFVIINNVFLGISFPVLPPTRGDFDRHFTRRCRDARSKSGCNLKTSKQPFLKRLILPPKLSKMHLLP